MLRRAASVLGACLLGALGSGCLPGDERPTPASIELGVETEATSSAGFVTDDGWEVRFDEILAGLGTVRLEGDACNPYSEAFYSRVFDFSRAIDAPAKVALVHGIGDCRLEFRLRAPQDDSILGEGVAASEVDAMRAEIQDSFTDEPERTSVRIVGSAEKGGQTRSFDWSFRKRYDIADCIAPEGGGSSPSYLDLQSDQQLVRTAQIDASALFRVPAPLPPGWNRDDVLTEDPAAGVPTDFQMFADADTGLGALGPGGSLPPGDGVITLEELSSVDADTGELLIGGTGEPPDLTMVRRLADVLYDRMVPAMVRLDGSACTASVDGRR